MRVIFTAFALTLLLTGLALADGKGFAARATPGSVQTADQRAVIVYHEGQQTLVIDTTFESSSEDLAWLIPLPAVPQIERATAGLFPTLEYLFTPRTVGSVAPYWLLAGFICLPFAFVILRPAGWWKSVLIMLLVALLLVVILLPSLGRARGVTGSDGVHVHSRQLVGAYQTATLESEAAEDVLDWLAENNYHVPDDAGPVIEDYIGEGWVFVAVKLRQTEARGTLTPHPLTFTFDADRCVYPMRLTAIDQHEPLTLDLFVLAAQEARADGLEAVTTLPAERPEETANYQSRAMNWPYLDNTLPIKHPYLNRLTDPLPGAFVGTRLRGKLTPQQMQHDIELAFHPLAKAQRAQRYTQRAAVGFALNVGITGFFLLLLILAVYQRLAGRTDIPATHAVTSVLIALTIGTISYTWPPRADAHAPDERPLSPFRILNVLEETMDRYEYTADEQTPFTAEAIRTFITSTLGPDGPAERDAPGHWLVRETNDQVEIVVYDFHAGEHLVWRSDE